MFTEFINWFLQFGYAGVFLVLMLGIVGIPFPDEWILMFAGYAVFKGKFCYPIVVMVAAAGAMCGISLSYLIGRTVGPAVVHRFGRFLHVTQKSLDRTQKWFDRVGKWTLPLGYFVPGARHVTAILAGASKMRFGEFAAFAYSGATVWVITFVTAGFFLGDGWSRMSEKFHHYAMILAGMIVLAVAVVALVRYLRQRKKAKDQPPDSDAK